ncbi:MAG TPA: HAD family hydrolase [Candidatus Saccharimonadales bacterium]
MNERPRKTTTVPTRPLIPGPRYDPAISYKVVAALFDVDNTLVDGDTPDVPTKRFKSAVHAARGTIKVSIASARPLSKVAHIIDYVGADGLAILSNGAQIYDCFAKEMVAEFRVKKATCAFIVSKLAELGVDYWVNDDGVDYFSTGTSVFARQKDIWNQKGGLVPAPEYTFVKPLVIVAHAVTGEVAQKINEFVKLSGDTTATSYIAHELIQKDGSKLYDVFVTHMLANKKAALHEVAKRQQLDLHNVMVVGDGRNDVDIIEAVGVGVAMGNSAKETLEAAVFIAPDQRNDGAAVALEYFTQL